MRNLLRAWPTMKLSRGVSWTALFLDYDGTLAPIAPMPEAAKLSAPMRRLLGRLAKMPGISVIIISGRSLRDVRAHVGIAGFHYAGNHGLEISGPGVRFLHPAANHCRTFLRRLKARLEGVLKRSPGAWVESKGLTLSIHWRQVPRALQRNCHLLIAEAVKTLRSQGKVRVTRGKCVTEIRPPVDWNKGAAVLWLLKKGLAVQKGSPLICYLGDDQTDEDAFKVVNRLGGCSVLVGGQRSTAARYGLRSQKQVRQWLEAFAAMNEGDKAVGRSR